MVEITEVRLSRNPVETGEIFIISVRVEEVYDRLATADEYIIVNTDSLELCVIGEPSPQITDTEGTIITDTEGNIIIEEGY